MRSMAASGRKKWDYPTSKSWVIGTPAVRDGVVLVGTSDSSRFMALDAKERAAEVELRCQGICVSSPAIAGDLAYLDRTTAASMRST
jgi:outer membrane protein assembly factor BamB